MPPKKVEIKKGKTVPSTYLPKGLTKSDLKKQKDSILNKKDRPKIDSFVSKRSGWVKKFEDKYKHKITDEKWINDNLLKKKGQQAYYSSGSRPNQTPYSWGYGRLGSVLLGGASRRIDKKIWDKYKI